jgi:hypothetical protein
MISVDTANLTRKDIERVMNQANGHYALLELVRMGRVDSDEAVKALDKFEKRPIIKRAFYALIDTIFNVY